MTRFKLGVGRIMCPRCKEANLEVMAAGKLYKNGNVGKVIITINHPSDYFEEKRLPTEAELARFRELALKWQSEAETKEALRKNPTRIVPRDPSQSEQHEVLTESE